MENAKFQEWCIVELFGHTKLAGLVTPSPLSGDMIQVSVPEVEGADAFTKIVNIKAIYSITPVTEETAIAVIKSLKVQPITAWGIRELVAEAKGLPAPEQGDEDNSLPY